MLQSVFRLTENLKIYRLYSIQFKSNQIKSKFFITKKHHHNFSKIECLVYSFFVTEPKEASLWRLWPGADPGIYFGWGANQGPQSKVKGEARIEGAKPPSIEGEARVQGENRPRIEGEARTEGEAREKSGEGSGVWGGGSVSPSLEIFWKNKLETIHFGAYLK